jgi:hypothetical protein
MRWTLDQAGCAIYSGKSASRGDFIMHKVLATIPATALLTAGCIGLVLALAGCNVTTANVPPPVEPTGPPPTAQVPDKELFKQARQAVLASLKDPESARFGPKFERRKHSTRSGQPYEMVCGEVNSKNSFGGYGGMKMFVWIASDLGGSLPRVRMAEPDPQSLLPDINIQVTKTLCLGETGSTPSRGPA